MSWIKENKFLAGFTAATVVGAGALGFLLFQAKGKYDEASTNFEQESSELNRLQTSKPFPNDDNVKKLDAQKKQYAAAIAELQKGLGKLEIPLEQISPQQFMDRLRSTVDSIKQRAGENSVKLNGDVGNLGFDRYLSEPPRAEAAPALARELKAVEMILATLIKNRVTEIKDLARDEVPEERGGRAEADPAKPGGKSGKNAKDLVASSGVQIGYVTEQSNLMDTLNQIISAKEQFFIPRVVAFKSEKETGPLRNDPSVASNNVAPVPPPPQPGDPAAPPVPALPGVPPPGAIPGVAAAPPQRIIVGEEKVETTLRIEIVNFAAPATTASK